MKFRWTIGRKLAVVFAIALIIQIVVGVMTYTSIRRMTADQATVQHSKDVVGALDDMLIAVLDAETGERGYIITGDEAYLAPYKDAETRVNGAIADFRRLTAANPAQQKRLDAFEPLVTVFMAALQNNIDLRQSGGFKAARTAVTAGAVKNSMDEGRLLIAEARAEEDGLATTRTAASHASRDAATVTIVAGGAIAAIFLILAAIFLTRTIARPIRAIAEQLRALAKGGADLTARLTTTTKDEVGDLARAFNDFLGNLASIVQGVMDGSYRLSSATAQISSATNEISAGAGSQNEQVERTSSSMEEITAAVQEVARNAVTTAAATRAATDHAHGGAEKVAQTLAGLGKTDASLQQLRQRSEQINQIVSLIADIAAQTNLLALNAAIEAASAGEAGARFDVVAEEIRKLAQRTTESTGQIADTVHEIQEEVGTAVNYMGETVTQARETQQSLNDIVESIGAINDMMSLISSSTEQQGKAAEQVAEAMQMIAAAGQQTIASSRETAKTTDDLAGLAQELSATVRQFKV